jgi:hypothetical protein
MKLVDLVEMKFKETIKETPMYLCSVPHSPTHFRRADV